MKIFIISLILLLGISCPLYAMSAEAIGQIQTLQGSASVLRGTTSIPAKVGFALQRGDLIRTAKPGALGIILTDDTTISLGPNSELALNEYVFAPKDGKFALVARMAKGTFVYLSGLISKLSPNAVQLLIPDATIAVRGTKLLVDVQE
jgi:hypothetical protein